MIPNASPRLPGRMTAVMRAVSVVDNRAYQARVLRIAIVKNGRVAEERILRDGDITFGAAEDATFVLRGASRSHRLFERRGSVWHLNLHEGLGGRVALANGIADVSTLGRGTILNDDARGKIVMGDTTILFQLVAPPPIAPTPRLPLAVTGSLANRIDWSLTIVAALSFLFHFGIVGAMYSDWMDPVADSTSVATLVDLKQRLPQDLPLETKPIAEPGTVTDPAKKEPVAVKEPSHAQPGPTSPSRPGPSNPRMSDERAAAMAKQADAMNMGMIVSLEGGPATKGALDRSEIPAVDMSSAAASAAAVAKGNGDLKTTAGGDTQDHKGSLSTLAQNGTKKDGTDKAGDQGNNAAPVPIMTLQPAQPIGSVSDADAVVAKLRSRFRKCYQTGLDSDPTMRGKVTLEANVGSNGEVTSVGIVGNSGLSSGVAACLQQTLSRAQFTANGPSKVRVPVAFDHQ